MPLTATITWQISLIEVAGFSTWSSIACGPSGQPAVAYHASEHGALRFAVLNASGAWDIETVDAAGGDSRPSLRYRFSQPAISYCSTEAMKFALRRGGSQAWTINSFARGGLADSSLAIDESRKVGISYQNHEGELHFTRPDSSLSVWVGSEVEAARSGTFNSLAFGPDGQPAIAYTAKDEDDEDVIRFAAFDGAQWNAQTVGPGDGWCTLVFAAGGEPAIVYSRSRTSREPGAVVLSVLSNGTWHHEVIAQDADSPSVAVSAAGTMGVSYHHASGAVNYAVFLDRAWQHFLVHKAGDGPPGTFGDFTLTSLAFDAAGNPAISYYDRGSGAILCATGTVTLGVLPPGLGGPGGADPTRIVR